VPQWIVLQSLPGPLQSGAAGLTPPKSTLNPAQPGSEGDETVTPPWTMLIDSDAVKFALPLFVDSSSKFVRL
jgi:hypothetical protein